MALPGGPIVFHYARATIGFQQAALQVAAQGLKSDADIVKAMRVTETSFTRQPRQLSRLVAAFWEPVGDSTNVLARRSLDRRVQLDGTEYRVRVSSERTDASFTLLDDEAETPDHPGRLPIVRWINNLLRDCNAELESAQKNKN